MTMTGAVDGGVVIRPWPFRVCGSCGGDRFTTTSVAGVVVFTCVACDAHWRYALGYLLPVDLDRIRHGSGATEGVVSRGEGAVTGMPATVVSRPARPRSFSRQ
jgi:hypothetical protein